MLDAFKKGFGETVGVICGCLVLSIVSDVLKVRTKTDEEKEKEKETENQKDVEESL